jgi:hypothetical protein
MRKGTFDRKWITDGDTFIGVSLGSDYCAEHEWGIKDIRNNFGVIKSVMEKRMLGLKTVEVPLYGIDLRMIHKNPVSFFQQGDTYILGYSGGNPEFLKSLFKTEKDYLERASEGLLGLWDGRSFALLSKDKEKMEALRDAFDNLDIALFLGASAVFSNGSGLNICIASKMPKEVIDGMRASDMNADNLRKAADKTGIEAKLQKANCRFYALSPRWKPGSNQTEVDFWLNPLDQQSNNYGQFTVEELEQWIKGEGPIPMKKQEEVEQK